MFSDNIPGMLLTITFPSNVPGRLLENLLSNLNEMEIFSPQEITLQKLKPSVYFKQEINKQIF